MEKWNEDLKEEPKMNPRITFRDTENQNTDQRAKHWNVLVETPHTSRALRLVAGAIPRSAPRIMRGRDDTAHFRDTQSPCLLLSNSLAAPPLYLFAH